MSKSFSWLTAQKLEREYWDMVALERALEHKKNLNISEESLYRFSKILSLLNEYSSPQNFLPEFCLDVGCGPDSGIFAILENFKMKSMNVGVDSQARSYQGKKSNRIAPIAGIAEKLPLRSQTFDITFCVNALDHTADPVKTIEEIYRVTKKGGILYLMTHIVTPKKKTIFRLFHSRQSIKQFLYPLTMSGYPQLFFHGILKLLGIMYRENLYIVFIDGYLHPHYFNSPEIIKILKKAGYSLIKENITTDIMESARYFKLGAYYICLKP